MTATKLPRPRPPKVHAWMDEQEHAPIGASQTLMNFYGDGPSRNAHPAIIYGPGFGANGRTIR